MITYLVSLISVLFGINQDSSNAVSQNQEENTEVNYSVEQTEANSFYHS